MHSSILWGRKKRCWSEDFALAMDLVISYQVGVDFGYVIIYLISTENEYRLNFDVGKRMRNLNLNKKIWGKFLNKIQWQWLFSSSIEFFRDASLLYTIAFKCYTFNVPLVLINII